MRSRRLLAVVGPGLLVAATGVGAGDLATAGFAGSRLGTTILWSVLVGAGLKWVLAEGIARWQLVTGETVLEGVVRRLGWPARTLFLVYLLPWSFFVGAALISACGVTFAAIVPWPAESAGPGRIVYGAVHSGLGLLLAWRGGYRLVEKVMAVCVAVMFVTVVTTAILVGGDPGGLLAGLFVPRIPQLHHGGLTWTIALMGGVGGTLTILCYGYWIREKGWTGPAWLGTSRLDLAIGYGATALFGVAMVIIAADVELAGGGSGLIVALANQLATAAGMLGRWAFLIGAWAAVFSSLLGVWQAVPYLFADFWRLHANRRAGAAGTRSKRVATVRTTGRPYRLYLLAIAVVPLLQVGHPFREVQKLYAVVGAAFLPLLAAALLVLGGRPSWIGARYRNGSVTVILLVATLALSVAAGYLQVRGH
jgi:Mn2+/Fe2+ NRAMP family transporter